MRDAPARPLLVALGGAQGPVERPGPSVVSPDEAVLVLARAVVPCCPTCRRRLLWYRLADVGGAGTELWDRHAQAARHALASGVSLRSWFWICDRCQLGALFDPTGITAGQ